MGTLRWAVALLAPALPGSAISISVYIAAPNVVSSPVTGGTAVDENFSRGWGAGLYRVDRKRNIGTFQLSAQSALSIRNSDQYGGAGNSGRYAAFGAQSGTAGAVTLNLANPTTFFGMWWSAIDAYNGVSLYSGDTFLMRISGSDIIGLLGTATLTAQNGTTYNRTSYLGKPGTNPRQNPGEYYAYTMFHASGLTFNRVVFDNSGTTATGFEMDNLQVRSGNFVIPGTTVLLTQYQITAVPEPRLWIPAGLGLAACAWWRRRRRAAGGR
ncbi:MAG: Npun_F0296 family exosortase-dependent surface protein [Bryobacteraceae bacterium]